MYLDVVHLRAFYDLPLGRLLRSLIGAPIREMWPELNGQRLLGLGYAGPFMRALPGFGGTSDRGDAGARRARCPGRVSATVPVHLVEDASLPFPDISFDRIMLVHALDHCSEPEAVLKEAWRLLSPGGRLIAVVPNRRGLWAQSELSPFGYGRPYSGGQLKDLLKSCEFNVVDDKEALFMPPSKARTILRAARTWEGIGRRIWPVFGGVLVVEAEKVVFQSLPADGKKSRLRVLRPVFIPEGVATGLKPVRAVRSPEDDPVARGAGGVLIPSSCATG